MTQLLEMMCGDYRIGLCQIGELDPAPLRAALELTESQVYLHSMLGGPIDWEEGEL
jgi:hypothetical protein